MKEGYFQNDYVELWVEDGIIFEVFKPEIKEVTLEIAIKVVEARLKVSNRIRRPIFIDMSNARQIDKYARDYFAEKNSISYLSAAAVLLNSYAAWLGGKLFLAFNEPSLKIELFKSKVKAISWLQNYK